MGLRRSGVVQVMGAPVAGSDLRAYVLTGGGLRLKSLRPKLRSRRLQMIFPLTGTDRRGLVSLEAKKSKVRDFVQKTPLGGFTEAAPANSLLHGQRQACLVSPCGCTQRLSGCPSDRGSVDRTSCPGRCTAVMVTLFIYCHHLAPSQQLPPMLRFQHAASVWRSDQQSVRRGGMCSSCWRWTCRARRGRSSASTWRATSTSTTAAPSCASSAIPSSTCVPAWRAVNNNLGESLQDCPQLHVKGHKFQTV